MIVSLEAFAASEPLVAGCAHTLAAHNARWFAREQAQGRLRDFAWFFRLRYDEPAVSPVMRLRDAPIVLGAGAGGCLELAAVVVGWARASGQQAEIVTSRPTADTWHFRVHQGGRVWDPTKAVPRAA